MTAGVLQVAKQAQDFLTAVTGHPGESIGTILGNAVKRRLDNVEAVSSKAQFILLDVGVKAREIPLPILQPALEAASMHEDSYLQDTWANLLANAADERQKNPVEPSFARILAELSAREVGFLNALYKTMDGVLALYLSDIVLVRTFVDARLYGALSEASNTVGDSFRSSFRAPGSAVFANHGSTRKENTQP